mgnify:FL=1
MKILITTDCYVPMINGVVTSILNLETQLRKRGHEVKILCPSQCLRGENQEDIIRIGSIGIGKHCNGARAAVCFRKSRLQKLISWKPDIIHSQSEFFSFSMAKKIAAAVGCPIVHTYHTIYEDYTHYFSPSITLGRKAVIAMTRHILQHTAGVIAPSHKVETLLRSYGVQKPIAVIPTGLNLRPFAQQASSEQLTALKHALGIQPNQKVLLTVGRVAKEKNLEELICYFGRLSLPDAVLCIVGDGTYLPTLKQLALEKGIADRVIFTDAVEPSKIPIYYQIGDVFLSAQSETQGLTYLEALASGLPLVCRKDPCLDGIVTDGFNGGLYTSFETFQHWIMQTYHQKQQFTACARQTADQFSAAAFAEKVETYYKQILENQQIQSA